LLVQAERTQVYRGRRLADGQPVILKTNTNEYPTPAETARLKHEFDFNQQLNLPGVIRVLELVQHGSRTWLVVEDIGGESLKGLLEQGRVDLEGTLQIAVQVVQVLGQLHQRNIVHRDVKPHNLIVNVKTWEARLTDFEHASVLDRESQAITSPDRIEGTLAYMSPEQTGRMNRAIDYRTDFYSLGVTLYQALTGVLPFEAHDPMEWVHCHIARTPEPPHARNAAVPEAVSAIVMKLLAKTAEERYQSAYGLRRDLEACLTRIRAGTSLAGFVPAQHDSSEKFQIPQQLYGRDAERAELLRMFKRVAEGSTGMMLICGYSGIGKSALVNEVQKPIVEERGYFTSGKFDQFERGVPYSAFIRAFTELLRQILTSDEAVLSDWRKDLLKALGPNAQVVVEVIPELEAIIGQQPPVPYLPPLESQNRFKLVFQEFVSVFAQASHPLVVFLDDLQWADAGSLQMIQTIMSDPDNSYLLIIGAYRDNEVTASHPLMLMLGELAKSGTLHETLTLGPLTLDHLTELVSGVVRTDASEARPLAEIVMAKTAGNPFFANVFLASLHREGLLKYDPAAGRWRWDAAQIEAKGYTDNVVEFMADKILTLDEKTRASLKTAACLGNQFNLHELAVVLEQSPRDTAAALWEAVREGLVQTPQIDLRHFAKFSTEEAAKAQVQCKFVHDRVQQAAYSLVPEPERPALHLHIGRLLRRDTTEAGLAGRIFEITRHLNSGRDLITEVGEREQLVRLNLIAGRKAKQSAAYESALRHLTLATDWLTADDWERNYEMAFGLYKDRIECEFLCSHPEVADQLVQSVTARTRNRLDQAALTGIQAAAYSNLGKLVESANMSLAGLRLFGVDMEFSPKVEALMAEVALTQENLAGRSIASLIDSPELADAEKSAVMRMLMGIIPPAYYLGNSQLMTMVALKMVNISLKHGNADVSAYAYALWGMVLGAAFGDYKTGLEYGELGIKLNARLKNEEIRCKVNFVFGVFIQHWRRPLQQALPHLKEAYQAGLESGDVIYGGWMPFNYTNYLGFCGVPAREVCREIQKFAGFLKWTGDTLRYHAVLFTHQFYAGLRGLTHNRLSLSDDTFDEDKVVENLKQRGYAIGILWHHILKAYLHLLFEDYHTALNHAQQANNLMQALFATYYVAKAGFLHSLILVGVIERTAEGERKELEEALAANARQMDIWAENCPENYLHKSLLIKAERARLAGQRKEAEALYDQAIHHARENGFVMDEALANELAARCFLQQNRRNIAKAYIMEARHAYERSGAATKVLDLEAKHPELLPKVHARTTVDASASVSTSGASSTGEAQLDLATVIKASQSILGEINLENLLRKLMRLLMENAGAQSGALILEHEGALLIQALGAVDESQERVMLSEPIATSTRLPVSMVNYVARTRKHVVLDNAVEAGLFTADPYIIAQKVKSALCLPIVHQGKLTGVLYLENRLAPNVFTADRLKVLNLLSSQAAISLENALLYRTLEQRVADRTSELKSKNDELHTTLEKLKAMQNQLITQEKMASLGQLTAGISHEIKNPLNFVNNFSALSLRLVNELREEIAAHRAVLPGETAEIVDDILNDLASNCGKINEHGRRADGIVQSMMAASRGRADKQEKVILNHLVEDSANLAYQALRANDPSFNLVLERDYDASLAPMEVVSQDLRRVLLNMVNNGSYAAIERGKHAGPGFVPTIRVSTRRKPGFAEIRVRDNGTGMSAETLKKLFTPFFTTKPTGLGTGLGLSICYDIIKAHKGEIKVTSEPDRFTEFTILLPVTD